ncbi:molybdenum cofactor guanylyltransferase [Undibacterium sp. LX40W]|uniref:Molybdenum cofactor guanylyltransferase n=1 Tax=Undibacterium nitidum TaxID=2762298 RepID=A0A923HVT8_9BURK|nr:MULTISPECIES: molybdenum cofactor guanylyltransferase MobA [Undibacterium]MBC3882279.1 molybdenum cofactor guanylyltransferase [Undibacterium nitidum]MBC3892560.1 molybdenum cofactor guanylyltransferase [Undibacterium sp. LX40W]
MIHRTEITGLILAGGRGMRMGHVNKGLQTMQGKTMVEHVIARLKPQVGNLIINANQDLERYREFELAVFPDSIANYAGPLAGLESGLQHCQTKYLLSAPCDSPFLPIDLANKLATTMVKQGTQIAVPFTEELVQGQLLKQLQPVFCLVERDLHHHLRDFLEHGGRKISDWLGQLRVSEVKFEDHQEFRNINTRAELNFYSPSIQP